MLNENSEKNDINQLDKIYKNFIIELRQIEEKRNKKISKIVKQDDDKNVSEILKNISKQDQLS